MSSLCFFLNRQMLIYVDLFPGLKFLMIHHANPGSHILPSQLPPYKTTFPDAYATDACWTKPTSPWKFTRGPC